MSIERSDEMASASILAEDLHGQINTALSEVERLVDWCTALFPSAGTDGGVGMALEQARTGLEQASPMLIQVRDKLREIAAVLRS